jgi:hypothetical protein
MVEQLKPLQVERSPSDLNRYDSLDSLSREELAHVPPVRSTAELLNLLERDESIEVDARVLAINPDTGEVGIRRFDRKGFLEAAKSGKSFQLREDAFGSGDSLSPDMGRVGDDFVPLLGGPFYKNLYTIDFFRSCSASFWAYNHDPIAHQALNIIKDFTLGRGYRVDSENAGALALWRAFEKVNNLQEQMSQFALELGIYGESCFWWLPDNATKIVQRRSPGETIPKGLIPRVRLLDPTVFWEVITWPEDPTRELAYVWVSPTQYQTYTHTFGNQNVPSSKFIFQQIPADQISRYKINVVTGEKRGRGDLFSVLGFLKRLRDSVNYSIIGLQRQASFCIDTVIRGSQEDVDSYISAQADLGAVAPAGSEFVHTDAIERKYLSPEGGKAGSSPAFEWALSMVAAGLGIPISYFGTHLSGGQTRASAIVSTEPVAKRFEMRQQVYERVVHDLWDRLMEWAGLGHVECEVTFPEIITADKSQKLKDLSLAQTQGWISGERAATIAAKELNITSFEYETEREKISGEKQIEPSGSFASPLTAPASAISSEQKNDIRRNDLVSTRQS